MVCRALKLAVPLLLMGAAVARAQSPEGEAVFKRSCAVCHTAEKGGPEKVGPNLFGLIGRKAGTIEGFRYSQANRNSNIVWSAETLEPYLENPRKVVPGTSMAFAGLRKPEDRKALIDYLDSLK